jgi:uncharacterized Zn finger protein
MSRPLDSDRNLACKACGRLQVRQTHVTSNLQGNQVRVTMKCEECGNTWSMRRFGPAIFQARRVSGFGTG